MFVGVSLLCGEASAFCFFWNEEEEEEEEEEEQKQKNDEKQTKKREKPKKIFGTDEPTSLYSQM